MAREGDAGFREIAHTADWELQVWAPNLSSLLEQAARGMYVLAGTRLKTGPRLDRKIDLQTPDRESLLVEFLAELIYLGEVEGLGFDTFDLALENEALHAQLSGAPVESQIKEIKAVTYHNLAIRETERGLEANIVFDV
jgi:SHS2 domain-containing protein